MAERPTKRSLAQPPRKPTSGMRKAGSPHPAATDDEPVMTERSLLVGRDHSGRNNLIIIGGIGAAILIVGFMVFAFTRRSGQPSNIVLAGTEVPELNDEQINRRVGQAMARVEALYGPQANRTPPVECRRVEDLAAVVKDMIAAKKPNGASARFNPGQAHLTQAGAVQRQVNYALRATINAANPPDLEYVIFRVYRSAADRQAGMDQIRKGRGETNFEPLGQYAIVQFTANIQGPAFLSIRDAINAFAIGFEENSPQK